ncbi:hypothetical protein T11_1006 [Trichinella zimbabwensis]|uniref:Uncharacterized protein n=1 Tax=Trichinella zimbabwensis TaxID=268475 RepID=A0A0V1I6R9_9BILA|nr:hypothetical protein T11_1006 [Trichinella zimbabwensis]
MVSDSGHQHSPTSAAPQEKQTQLTSWGLTRCYSWRSCCQHPALHLFRHVATFIA